MFVVAGLLPTKELELDDQPEQQQVVEEEMVVGYLRCLNKLSGMAIKQVFISLLIR